MSIALSSVSAFSAAIAHARSIDVGAYTLRRGDVLDTLIAAAQAGAAVRVRLERSPFGDTAAGLHQANADAVDRLRAAGADAALGEPSDPVLHMKAAVVDGVAWLDDRNWVGDRHETVVRDTDADDVAAVTQALRSEPGGDGPLRTTKAGAQYLEVDVIRAAGVSPLAVQTESFGSGIVYNALLARARAGLPSRLLVAGREAFERGPDGELERRKLARLAGLGVEVRTGDPAGLDLDEKLAIAADAAWVGSANATSAWGLAGEQRDWGLSSQTPAIVDGLRREFEANWRDGRVFADGTLREASCAKPSANTSVIRPPDRNFEPR